MHRETLVACAPYLVAIIFLLIGQSILLRCSGARLQLAHLRRLHRDQAGAVQSVSFVFVLPVFIFVMMFIVQLCLITMARISVEFSAYAAARSAIVWFPANLGTELYAENRVSPSPLIPIRQYEDGGRTYTVYQVVAGGDKFARIHLAAAMACMPICPSMNTGAPQTHPGNSALPSIQRAYAALAPGSSNNSRVPARLRNKLAYALENTRVKIEVHHCGDQIVGGDPPLYPELSLELDLPTRYLRPNEIGWQDQVYVTVIHEYALLPGPGRLLAGGVPLFGPVADEIHAQNGVYSRTLVATARLGNEGQKPTPTIPTFSPSHPRSYIQPLPWLY